MVPIQIFVNILLFFLLSFILFKLHKKYRSNKLLIRGTYGLIVGVITYLSILFPISVPGGTPIDFSPVSISLATLLFGGVTGLFSALTILGLSLLHNSANLFLTLSVVIFAFIAGLSGKYYKDKKEHKKNTLFHFYIFGIFVGVVTFIIVFLFHFTTEIIVLLDMFIYYLGTSPLIFLLIGYFYLEDDEREKVIKKLFRSEARYKLITDNISEVISLIDLNLNLVFVTPSIENMLGYSYRELLNKNISSLMTEKSVATVKEVLEREIDQQLSGKGDPKKRIKAVLEEIKKDGTHRLIENTASFIKDNRGNPLYLLVISRDVTENLKTEEKLKLSEEKFKTIFETIPDPVTITIVEDGTYVEVNKAFEEVSGYLREEVLGKTAFDINVWENENDRKELVKILQETGKVNGLEVKFRLRDNTIVDALISGTFLEINGVKHLLLISKVITELKEAINAAKSSEANLTALINNGDESIWSIDTRYNYIVFNKKFKDDFWEAHNIKLEKGLNAIEILNIEEKIFWKSKYDIALTGKKIGFIYTKNVGGKVYHMNVFLSPIYEDEKIKGVSAIAMDITEKRNAEIELEESEKRYKAMFELNRAPMVIIDAETGNIVDVNDSAVRLYGYEKKALLTMNISEINTDTEDKVFEEIQTAIKGKSEHNFLIKTGSGLLKHVEVYSSVIEIKGKKYIYSIINDVTEKIESQQALSESEKTFRTVYNSISDAILITEIGTGKIIDINPGFERIMGYGKDEIAGKTVFDIMLWKDFSQRDILATEVGEKGYINNFEAEFVSKEGKVITGLISTSTIFIQNKPYILTTAKDVTEINEAIKKLKESEKRYRTIFEGSKAILLLIDAETADIIDANDSAVEFYGWKREKLLSMKISEINILPGDEIKRRMKIAAEQKKNYFLFTHRTAGNEMKEVEVYVTPILLNGRKVLFSLINDVTEKRKYEAELEENRKLLELSQKIAGMGSWKLNILNDELYWSNEVYEIFGYSPQEFPATYEAFLDVVHPEDRKLVDDAYTNSIKNNEDSYQVEHRIIRKDNGDIRNVFERCVHYRDEEGNIYQSVGIVYDITEMKKKEKELIDLIGRLTNSEEEMRKRVSLELHDTVGQYLSALSIYLGELKIETLKGNSKKESILDRIDISVDMVKEVTERIRDIMTELRPRMLDDFGLNAGLKWALENITKRLPIESFYYGKDLADEPPLEISYILLRVAQEALHNVQKHSNAQTVEMILDEDDREITIKIEDDGKGFDKEEINRIKRERHFGLSSMDERIKYIGGVLDVKSQPGKGTMVIIRLSKDKYVR